MWSPIPWAFWSTTLPILLINLYWILSLFIKYKLYKIKRSNINPKLKPTTNSFISPRNITFQVLFSVFQVLFAITMTRVLNYQGWRLDPTEVLMIILLLIGMIIRPLLEFKLYLSMKGYIKHDLVTNLRGKN